MFRSNGDKFSILQIIHSFDCVKHIIYLCHAIPKVTPDFEICTPLVVLFSRIFSLMGARYIFFYKYVQDFEKEVTLYFYQFTKYATFIQGVLTL